MENVGYCIEFSEYIFMQATMPSSEKRTTYVPMWRGVKVAYLIIALCLFPLAIGGYLAYGQKVYINPIFPISFEGIS